LEIFVFFWGALAWTVTVAALWPINIPMAALSFRIWRETKASDIEGTELWIRAFLASTCITVIAVVFVAIDYVIVELMELPPGPVHITVFVGMLALACVAMLYMFSLEDFFQGLSLAMIYLFLPVLALFLLNGLLGLLHENLRFWDPVVKMAAYFLTKPT
jgi:hypothetical protein